MHTVFGQARCPTLAGLAKLEWVDEIGDVAQLDSARRWNPIRGSRRSMLLIAFSG